jgi:hypothetical protein
MILRHFFRLPLSSFVSQRASPVAPSEPFPVSKLLRQQGQLAPFTFSVATTNIEA